MAREESYKDFLRFLVNLTKSRNQISGDSVKLSKDMRKTQDKMTKFCLRFSKLELKYGSFYYLLLKVYTDYGLTESSQKSLTI